MRTPWRFVADLVSRKPKPHGHDESPAVESKTIPLEYKPVPEEESPVLNATTVDLSAKPVSEAQVDARRHASDTEETDAATTASISAEAAAVAVSEVEPTSLATKHQADETPPASTGIEAAGALVKPASPRRKAMSVVEPVDSIDRILPGSPAMATIPKSFADEMAALDAEVAALRRQLAKKLVEQNAQLRKMLARFGGR